MTFETAALDVLKTHLASVSMADYGLPAPSVFSRVIDGTDPNLSIGAFVMSWNPSSPPDIGGFEPTYGRYTFGIGTLLKATERETGEQLNAVFVKRIRNALYRHKPLLDALHELVDIDDDDTRERYQKSGVMRVDFTDGTIKGGFAFVSQIEFFIETEVT